MSQDDFHRSSPELTAATEATAKPRNGEKTQFRAGNPGKPRGARNKTTRAIEALLDGEAEGLTRKAIALALEGDVTALRLCLDRISPAPKDRVVYFDLPAISTLDDLPAALLAILGGAATGAITPTEANSLAALVEGFRRASESADLLKRIEALEANHA